MKNLFSALHTYYQRADNSPQENQITEMLAQVVTWKPEFARFLFRRWFPALLELERPQVETQLSVKISEASLAGTKFIDLAVFDDVERGRELAFVVEIKWWSGANWSADEEGQSVPQTQNYNTFIESCNSRRPVVGRLYLTRRVEPAPDGWTARRWADVHAEARRFLRTAPDTEAFGTMLLKEFVSFLEEQNVDEKPLVIHDLAHLSASIEIFQKMERLFREVASLLQAEHKLPVAGKVFKGSLGGNLASDGNYSLYFSLSPNLSVCWCIYPGERFHDVDPAAQFPEGLPIAVVTIDTRPGTPEAKRFRESRCMRLIENTLGWARVLTPDRFTVVHASLPITDLPHTTNPNHDDLGSRVVQFFLSKYRELVEAGIQDYVKEG